jgi:predicted lipoprotein with Yx(FWY)xxD motif
VKRIFVLIAGVAVLALSISGVASAKHSPTVKLAKSSLGKILVDGKSGFTLYMFSKDARNKDTCAKINMCPGTWPALTTKGKPTGGPGVKASLLGTITLAHGVKQLTYAGHPLYSYTGDSTPAQTDYVGQSSFNGKWYAVNAAGHRVG